MNHKVVILGASDNPERYAYKAFHLLKQYGHECTLINPKLSVVEGTQVLESLNLVNFEYNTLTLYLNPKALSQIEDQILNSKFKRVIFNPGTENSDLIKKIKSQGKEVVEGCTLVMLKTNQF